MKPRTTMKRCVDETGHSIYFCKFESSPANRKYKEQKLNEIIAAICAMLNSNGGKVILYNEFKCKKIKRLSSLVVRILEQSMISIIGLNQTVSNINFKEDKESIIISVKKADSLITTTYNLYLPSRSQVVQVSPLEPLEKVKHDIINRKVVHEPVQLDSHCKTFVKDTNSSFQDNKSVQLKHLKAVASKRTTLADRMTGKGNKFSCYVSAFANHNGGHIYYGIRDDGIVEGEWISNENDQSEIRKKVEKVFNKMTWPEQIGQPTRGEHWEIFFEPVKDENSKPIPSTFVIVIYIAACLGGVFTEEPECYEMVEGKVEKMSIAAWKKRVFKRDYVDIRAAVQRIEWSSSATERHCTKVREVLMTAINNGKWEIFSKYAKLFEDKYPEVEVKLMVLSRRVIASYRQGRLYKARLLLVDYDEFLPKANDPMIFEVIYLCLEAALKRAERKFEAISKLLESALFKADQLTPGIITAVTLSFAAMNQNFGRNEDGPSSAELSKQVLEHLKYAPRSPAQVEMEHKAYIILATFHLGYNMSGKIIEKHVNQSRLETAKSSLMALNESVCSGYSLSRYREVQFNLVQSTLYYRYAQVNPEKNKIFLEEAFQFSKKAQHLARASNFDEMVTWANVSVALYTEKLVLASLAKMDWVKKIYLVPFNFLGGFQTIPQDFNTRTMEVQDSNEH
ncbi:schlafen family member 13-like [Paramuricea clavata]|uniref:Schlafen family member 13-like n=1 Tax=Paramuricea clavata TaxID=317549 RepID=A0A6S7LBV6_PARCT|nr:schlafen family member 13-like [Paramuricea clavata]